MPDFFDLRTRSRCMCDSCASSHDCDRFNGVPVF